VHSVWSQSLDSAAMVKHYSILLIPEWVTSQIRNDEVMSHIREYVFQKLKQSIYHTVPYCNGKTFLRLISIHSCWSLIDTNINKQVFLLFMIKWNVMHLFTNNNVSFKQTFLLLVYYQLILAIVPYLQLIKFNYKKFWY